MIIPEEIESKNDVKKFTRRKDGSEYDGYVIKRIKFSGFIAHFSDGKTVKEQDVRSVDTGSISTNWHEFDKSKLICLELVNNSISVAKYSKKDNLDIKSEDWFFCCSGYIDSTTGVTTIIARKIGVINQGVLSFTRVVTTNGIVQGGMKQIREFKKEEAKSGKN